MNRSKPGEGAGVRVGGQEAMWNATGDGFANPLPNTTGVQVRICSAVRGYSVIPRFCTQLRAERIRHHTSGSN